MSNQFNYESTNALNEAKEKILQLMKTKFTTETEVVSSEGTEGEGSEGKLQTITAKYNNVRKLFNACNSLISIAANTGRHYFRSVSAYIDVNNNLQSILQLLESMSREMRDLLPNISYCEPESILVFKEVASETYDFAVELETKMSDVMHTPPGPKLKVDEVDSVKELSERVTRLLTRTVSVIAGEIVQSHNYSRTSSGNKSIAKTSTDERPSTGYKQDLSGGGYLNYVYQKSKIVK